MAEKGDGEQAYKLAVCRDVRPSWIRVNAYFEFT